MDMIFEVISFIIAVIGIPASIDYYPRKFPIIKKGWYLITNNHYNVKIIGTKEYISFEYDLKTIKKVIHEKYSVYKINLLNKNSINVYLKNMKNFRDFLSENNLENSLRFWKKFLGDDFDYSKSS